MKPPYYYLEKVSVSGDSVYSVALSYQGSGINMDPDHFYCITVLGSKSEATERAVKILGALNDQTK